jgi:hypothetical protein
VKLVKLLVASFGSLKLYRKYASTDPVIVGAGDVGSADFVESDWEKPEIKVRHTIEPKKIFLNIVLDLKINNERGVTN